LKKSLVTLIVLALMAVVVLPLLAGCTTGPVLRIFNWEDYIDPDVLTKFTKETGIKVKYVTITDNEKMYTKIKSGAKYDVVFPSDYMIQRLIAEDLLAKVDTSKMTNFANVSDFTLGRDFDADNDYSVPYMWGTLGILYNTAKIAEVTDFNALWDANHSGQIIMMDSVRDATAVALMLSGYTPNDITEASLAAAQTKLMEQKPLLMKYALDEAKNDMKRGNATMALVYSGDASTSILEAAEAGITLDYVAPEGTNIWFDNMVVPAASTMQDEAARFIDFMCREDIALMNAEYIGYFSPIGTITEDLIAAGDQPDLLPTQAERDLMVAFTDPSQALREAMDKMWTSVKAKAK